MPGYAIAKMVMRAGVVVSVMLFLVGCTHPLVRTLKSYKAARNRGDYVAASAFLASDARSWWETKKGPGKPLKAKRTKGRWADWDHYFNAQTQCGKYVVDESSSTVFYTITEINDFYRLIDRGPTQARYTYYFDSNGKICGKLFDPLRDTRGPDRYDEAEAWAKANRPDELAYLMPEGDIIPDIERAKRWRAMLTDWREAVGLPAITDSP